MHTPYMVCIFFCLPPCFKITMHMKIIVNNKETEVSATTILELVRELGMPEKGIAVALSRQMVPREKWNSTRLEEGADIIIVKAVCGG